MKQKGGKINPGKIVAVLLLTVLAGACLTPFLMVVSVSLSSEAGFARWGYSVIPRECNLNAYQFILRQPQQILGAYGLTIFVTVAGTVLGMICMTAMAYVISREDFRGRRILSFYIYFTMLFSGGMVANYIWIARYLKLLNSPWAIILPLMMNAWNIFILRFSCKNIPYSLIENAKIEGAGELRIFALIIVPLAKTGIATITLLTAFNYWNDWFSSMMYMDTARLSTLQYYLVRVLDNVEFAKLNASASGGLLNAQQLPDKSIRMAICVLAAGPMLCVFPFFQRYFVKGIAVGSVKG